MKQYKCVELSHHKYIAKTIQKKQEDGWRLHTYQTAGLNQNLAVNHYLLLKKEEA